MLWCVAFCLFFVFWVSSLCVVPVLLVCVLIVVFVVCRSLSVSRFWFHDVCYVLSFSVFVVCSLLFCSCLLFVACCCVLVVVCCSSCFVYRCLSFVVCCSPCEVAY